MKITIVGGAGEMGQWFSKFFRDLGFDVTICDINKRAQKTASELGVKNENDLNLAVPECDIVFIAVPIDSVEKVIKEVAPQMKSGSLLIEIASVKKGVLKVMGGLTTNDIELISIHPMFGPTTPDIKNELVILTPVISEKWLSKIKKLFEDSGAKTEVLSAERHDEIMSVVLGLTQFTYMAIGSTMRALDFDISQSRRYMSPVYEIMMDFVGRILGQDPNLYATIQTNPNMEKVRDTFILQCEYLSDLLKERNIEKFVGEMEHASAHFKDTDMALKRSDELLDYRLKLTKG